MNPSEEESTDLAQFREFLEAHGLTGTQVQGRRLPRLLDLLEWVLRRLPVRDSSERPFGPAGFTTIPEVRALLAPYEPAAMSDGRPNDGRGGHFYIDLLPASNAEQLLQLLPKANVRDRHEGAPSFAQFVELGRRFPEVRFYGYRITPDRNDERITITGYYAPAGKSADQVHRQARRFAHSQPDEYHPVEIEGEALMFAWWD
jgi:hypothetical protein